MKVTKNLGFLLLAIWMIISGLSGLTKLPIPSLALILATLGLVSGVFILLGK
jgi:hypothetical protein